MKPLDGTVNKNDAMYVIGNMANPKSNSMTNTRPNSMAVDQPGSSQMRNVIIATTEIKTNVAKSYKSDVIQNVDTLTPLTN